MVENILLLDSSSRREEASRVGIQRPYPSDKLDDFSAERVLEQNWDASMPMAPSDEPLLREALGATLRDTRRQTGFTLRELAKLANVSPGYLSELERGRKEVSSELLASVCHAMGISVASAILEAASMMTLDAAAAELASSMARVN